MDTKMKLMIRYALARNLVLPSDYHVNTHGLFIEISASATAKALRSEISWGSKEAMWLIGEDAIASSPITVRIFSVLRTKTPYLDEEILVQGFARSSLAHPGRQTRDLTYSLRETEVTEAAYENEKMLVFEETIDHLVPLNNLTTRDLNYALLPIQTLLFSTEHFGKLFSSKTSAAKIFRAWRQESTPQPIVQPSFDEGDDSSFTRFETLVGTNQMSEMLKYAERIINAKDKQIQKKQHMETTIQTLKQRAEQRVRNTRKLDRKRRLEIEQEQLLSNIDRAAKSLEQLKNGLRVTTQEASRIFEDLKRGAHEFHEEHQGNLLNSRERLKRSARLVSGKRLILMSEILCIYRLPHTLTSTQIRGMDLESSSEDERAVALGYLAHLISLLAALFDIQLRYSPVAFGSRSFVLDNIFFAPMMESSNQIHRIESLSAASALAASSGLFPLFSFGVERGAKWKCETGVQLLLVGVKQFIEVMRLRIFGPGVLMDALLPEKSISNLSSIKQTSSCAEILKRLKLLLADLRVFPPYDPSVST